MGCGLQGSEGAENSPHPENDLRPGAVRGELCGQAGRAKDRGPAVEHAWWIHRTGVGRVGCRGGEMGGGGRRVTGPGGGPVWGLSDHCLDFGLRSMK